MYKNYPKFIVVFLSVALGLITVANIGCHDDDDGQRGSQPRTPSDSPPSDVPPPDATPPGPTQKTTYFELRFDGRVSTHAKAMVKITAIGKNGNGSRIYFGDDANVREVQILDPAVPNNVASVLPEVLGGTPNAAGTRKFVDRIFAVISPAAHRTVVRHVVPGPGNTAVIGLSNVGMTMPTQRGGVLRMDGNAVTGAWDTDTLDSQNLQNDQYLSALTVLGNNAVFFVNHTGATGSHVDLTANPPVVGISGPRTAALPAPGNLNKIVTAATSAGSNLYLATAGQVNKFAMPNAGALAGNYINFNSAADIVMSDAYLKIAPGTPNNDISAIAMVGGDLLIGLEDKTLLGAANTGGVAILKADGSKVNPLAAHEGWSIKDIAVSSDNKTALISTNKGLLFYFNGKLVKITEASLAVLTVASASNTTPVAINAPVPVAGAPGFGRPDLTHTNVGATHIGNTWYVATNNQGIFKVRMEEKQKK